MNHYNFLHLVLSPPIRENSGKNCIVEWGGGVKVGVGVGVGCVGIKIKEGAYHQDTLPQ